MTERFKTTLRDYVDSGDQLNSAHFNDLIDSNPNVFTKAAAPTANDDTGDGYEVGDIWLDTTNDKVYIVIDVTLTAAVWNEIHEAALDNIVEDTTPQLGGNLDVNGKSIVSVAAGDITLTPDTTGDVVLDGLKHPQADGSANQFMRTDGADQLVLATPPFDQPPYIVGATYLSIPGAESTDLTMTVDRLYGTYFQVTAPSQAFDRVSFEVQTAEAAKTARVGLYNVGTGGLPGALVTDFGTISVASTGGKEITISETLSYGWYVLAIVTDATTCDIEQINNVGHRRLGASNSSNALRGFVYVAHAYAALPDPFGSPTYDTSAREPKLGLRAA
ncbi:hypothetical protein LCGC14_1415560 [marine sediment metagenome]|uniref:Uncharacterized protein n=1 Tax=marine sediment metagenome TaxID=412755 RepID=A0A0F9MUN7_9ZZZZ